MLINTYHKRQCPEADFIEALGYASNNKVFRSIEFHAALIEYRKTKCRPTLPVVNDVWNELKYAHERAETISAEIAELRAKLARLFV